MYLCTLCQSTQVIAHSTLGFFVCHICDLIFKDPKFHLNPSQEKTRYLLHENDPLNKDYREFLNRLLEPLTEKINPSMTGLDFGCGPTTAVSHILKEKNIECASYDPHFFNDIKLLESQYDFIVCSEVVEHFYRPKKEFDLLNILLNPGGWLAVMTQSPPADFASWGYHRDPTHVSFFSDKTLAWIANRYSYEVFRHNAGVRLFKKKGAI